MQTSRGLARDRSWKVTMNTVIRASFAYRATAKWCSKEYCERLCRCAKVVQIIRAVDTCDLDGDFPTVAAESA